ncbi:hypothetical protein [Terracidiphilus gabretensis]|uniref:hypothetical protein n=1 Tax=Terracidiphilus gabretensis TaxID=1577687 RepID=UPI00071B421F|nr:hypothetical protein [Terracidiphilus gabretensis]
MSNCRTFNRSSRKEQQPTQLNPGIILVNQLAYDLIVANAEKFVNHFSHLFFEENKVTAGTTIVKFASGAVLQVSEEEGQARRPNLISRWAIECEQQDKDKKQNEAEAAQEAASRELGQIPDPAVEARAYAVAEMVDKLVDETVRVANSRSAQPDGKKHSNISDVGNTHVNEIGLPLRTSNLTGQFQTMDIPGSRSCRSTPRPSASGHEPKQALLNQSGTSIYA